jgi:hypothetical protein
MIMAKKDRRTKTNLIFFITNKEIIINHFSFNPLN